MIFVDSNVPMYLVGADHPNKERAQHLVEEAIASREALVTDVEVLQELLHRYGAIGRLEAIQPAFDALLGLVDEVVALDRAHAERAKTIVLGAGRLSARDALHIAVMEAEGISRIMTFDQGFDAHPGIHRIA